MIVPLAVAASLALAACGGGDSGDKKLSKSELAAKIDSICATAQTKVSAIKQPSNLGDPNAAAAYFTKVVDATQKQTDDLSALKPADDVKDDWNAFLDKQKAANDLLAKTRDAAKAKDPSGLTDFQTEAPKIAQEVDAAGKKLGATCGG